MIKSEIITWVKPEVDSTLKSIHYSLHHYAETLNNDTALEKISDDLRLLSGSLEMLQFHAAVLLVESMQDAVVVLHQNLHQNAAPNKEDVFESLLQATMFLEAYVDTLHQGKNDLPLSLLPAMNDIRASINEPLLSESVLFLPNLSIVPKTPAATHAENNETCLTDSAKSLRPYFQAALLSWYRDPSDTLSLQQMKLVASNLESSSVTPRNRQIWWIMGGIFEALTDKGIKNSISLKLLLAQTDRVLKTLSLGNNKEFEKKPPVDLLKNALYYISQTSSSGERINTLKQAYKLDDVIPSERDISSCKKNLNTPSSNTFKAIAKELGKSLEQVKISIDNFARNTSQGNEKLAEAIIPLKHISDTMSLLNRISEKRLVQDLINHFSKLVSASTPPGKDSMLEIATTMLHIDSALKNMGSVGAKEKTRPTQEIKGLIANESQVPMQGNLPESEHRLLVIKTVNEAKHNITEIKNHVLADLPLDERPSESTRKIVDLLSEIKGSMLILNDRHLPEILNSLSDYVRNDVNDNSQTDARLTKTQEYDLFAEALMRIEYYLEAIAEDRTPHAEVLELACDNLKNLGYPVKRAAPKETKTNPSRDVIFAQIRRPATRFKPNATSGASSPVQQSKVDNNILSFSTDGPGQEVREIFTEEALEVLDKMNSSLQTLKLSPGDTGTLATMRESFHLLKGSGKVAGAVEIGELSSSLDHFLARVECKSIKMNKQGISLLSDTQQFLYHLVGCFQNRTPDREGYTKFQKRISTPLNELEPLSKPSPLNETASSGDDSSEKTPPKDSQTRKPIETSEYRKAEKTNNVEAINTTHKKNQNDLQQLTIIENFISERLNSDIIAPANQALHQAIAQLKASADYIGDRELVQTTDLLSKFIHNIAKKQAPLNQNSLDTLSDFCRITKERLHEITKVVVSNDDTSQVKPVLNIEHTPVVSPVDDTPDETITGSNLAQTDDIDLIDIFLEEAQALITKGHDIVTNTEKVDDVFLSATQRLFHTLKGSARMAGITAIGNIAHTLESVFEAIISKSIPLPSSIQLLTQETLDAINDMIEDIQNGADVRPFSDLISKLEQVGRQPNPTNIKSNIETEYPIVPVDDTHSVTEQQEDTSEKIEPPLSAEDDKPPAQKQEETNNPAPGKKRATSEPIKVDATKLDQLVDFATEESAISNRIADHVTESKSSLLELDKAISRTLTQIQDLQFEASSARSMQQKQNTNNLNLSSFSDTQKQLQRVMESIGDIENLHSSLTRLSLETDSLIHHQKKIHNQLHENLLSARVVTFSVQTQRMQRILRQTCHELEKKAQLHLSGTDGSIDRAMLDTLMSPLEHIIRNAIAHGIESPANRELNNKAETGIINVSFSKDKSEHLIVISDDGAGLNLEDIRKKALTKNLIIKNKHYSDEDIANLIFEPGFSTSNTVSQISGRGVGMDVVLTTIHELGGSVSIHTETGKGSTFTIRLPFTLSRNHTIIIKTGNNTYAIPTAFIEHSTPVSLAELRKLYESDLPHYTFNQLEYPLWYVDTLLNDAPTILPTANSHASIILIKFGQKRIALHVDSIADIRDTVLKPNAPQLGNVSGIAGVTVMGDGKVVLIIDTPALNKLAENATHKERHFVFQEDANKNSDTITTMVVDDSITVRKVTERFLGRNGISTLLAKDGAEALEVLEKETPDVMLLDIEMPNMDGLELAKIIKTKDRLQDIPIIMITSRTGKQHRLAASEIGVDIFLGKPYQESELLDYIQVLTGKTVNH